MTHLIHQFSGKKKNYGPLESVLLLGWRRFWDIPNTASQDKLQDLLPVRSLPNSHTHTQTHRDRYTQNTNTQLAAALVQPGQILCTPGYGRSGVQSSIPEQRQSPAGTAWGDCHVTGSGSQTLRRPGPEEGRDFPVMSHQEQGQRGQLLFIKHRGADANAHQN